MDVMQIVEFACLRVIILHYILRPRHRAGSNQVYDNVITLLLSLLRHLSWPTPSNPHPCSWCLSLQSSLHILFAFSSILIVTFPIASSFPSTSALHFETLLVRPPARPAMMALMHMMSVNWRIMDDLRDSAIRCLNWLYLIGLEVREKRDRVAKGSEASYTFQP